MLGGTIYSAKQLRNDQSFNVVAAARNICLVSYFEDAPLHSPIVLADNLYKMSTFTSSLTWRRAAKAFGSVGPAPDISPVLKAIHLAPSSIGLQPYTVHVVTTPAMLAKLPSVCGNQQQVTQATAVLVFAAKKAGTPNGKHIVEQRHLREHAPQFADSIMKSMEGLDSSGKALSWSQRQAYIGLGFALAAAAEHRIASCPMEGFSPADLGALIGVPDDEEASVIMAIGRMHESDAAYTGGHPQWRKPEAELFKFL